MHVKYQFDLASRSIKYMSILKIYFKSTNDLFINKCGVQKSYRGKPSLSFVSYIGYTRNGASCHI